jgi:hypothetical protein
MADGLLLLVGMVLAAFLITVLGFWRRQRDGPLLRWTTHGGDIVFLSVFCWLVALMSVVLVIYLWLRG